MTSAVRYFTDIDDSNTLCSFFKILFLFTHLEEQAQITRKTETKEFISDILVRRFELSEL